MKRILSLAMSVGMALSMFAAASQPVGARPDNAPRRLCSSDLEGYRIALMSAVCYDSDENMDCQMYAPCVAVEGRHDSFYIPELCAGYPLTFYVDWDTKEASIPWATLLVSDTIPGTHASTDWSRTYTDTVRWVICVSSDYLINGNETDLMGAVLDDGKVVFSFDRDDENDFQNGIVYYAEEVYLTYNRRRELVSADTAYMISPVIASLELLTPNAKHEFKQVFYVEGTNPIVAPAPEDSADTDPADPNVSDFNDLTPGKPSDLIGKGNTCVPDGVGGGHWGGPIKPIVDPPFVPGDLVIMSDDGWSRRHSLDDLVGSSTFRAGIRPSSLIRQRLSRLHDGDLGHTTGFGPGHPGGPIKPEDLSSKNVPDGLSPFGGGNHGMVFSVSNPGEGDDTGNEGRGWSDLTPFSKPVEVEVSTEVYIHQDDFGALGRCVYIYNLFGNGRVNYFYVREDGTCDFPFQELEKDRNNGAGLYNYSTPTWNINDLEEGNTGTATSDALKWSVTVPHDPNASTGGGGNHVVERNSEKIDIIDGGYLIPLLVCNRPYYYHSNHVYFTDGSSFELSEPEVLNVSTVTRKIDAALRGEGSIADVTETINQLLKSAPGK